MHRDMEEQAVQVTWKTTQITASGLRTLVQTLLSNQNRVEHGKQHLKKLNLQNKQLESVSLTGSDVKNFKRELNKYSVDFSIRKDKTGYYTVFFKAQDVDRVYKGLENCIKEFDKDLNRKKPIKEIMKQAAQRSTERAISKTAPEKKHTVDRGQER